MDNQEAISQLKEINKEAHIYSEAVDMAISALQAQELSETQKALDTISRQVAIDALKDLPTWWADEGGYYGGAQPPMKALLDPEDAISAIENLPSAQPEQRWIPCSERMPEEETDVIVCSDKGKIEISSGSWSTELQGKWIWYTEGWRFGKVTAWMPLPEPARLEDE